MVHSRFSTNTFPSWDRAQPSRFMSHNGEINTLLGNINAMNARKAPSNTSAKTSESLPIVEPDCSFRTFDNVLEFLLMSGRSLPEALLMMIPEAWQQHSGMSAEKKAFYEYHSCLIEPWDGPPPSPSQTDPASVLFLTERPAPIAYYITDDDICIMASEVGVVPVDSAKIIEKGAPARAYFPY